MSESEQTIQDHDDKKTLATKSPVFKNLPIFFSCTNCDYAGYTLVEQRATYISYILTVLFMFMFGIMFSLLLMPITILLTRNYIHRCPSCLKEVGSDNQVLALLNLKDKVISFNIGEMGVVLSRKIILGIFLTLILIITVYTRIDMHSHHAHAHIVPIPQQWPEFLAECGRDQLFNQGMGHMAFCRNKYVDKTVIGWKGYVIRIEDYRNSLYSFIHHAVVILLKMEPSETEIYPDIMLALDSEVADTFQEPITKLNRGSQIGFNATFITIGDDMKTRHLHVAQIWLEDGFKEVPAHIHDHGRYADKPRFFKGPIASGADQPPAKNA